MGEPLKASKIVTVFGEPIEIIVPSVASSYTVCIGIQTSPPGGGPPPHRHLREEETFVVLAGEYEFFDGLQWSPFAAGEVRCSLRGNYHAFRNVGTTPGRMMFITNGGGLDEYFESICGLVLPQDMDRLNEISRYYNYEFALPEEAVERHVQTT